MEITTSPDISNLDFTVLVDIASPVPTATVTDISTYIGGGATAIHGLNVKIIDPTNLTLHNSIYPPTIDIYPGLGSYSINLPYFNAQVKWGLYKFYFTVIDSTGNQYTWGASVGNPSAKTIDVCQPNALQNATGNYGGLNLLVDPDCDLGQLFVQDAGTGFVYKGKTPSETVTNIVVTYPVDPTGTVTSQVATFLPFVLPLTLQGTYTIQGTVTQTYDLTDTTSIKVAYYYSNTFNVACGYTLCNALCDYEQLIADVAACNIHNVAETAAKQKQLQLFTALLTKVSVFKNCGKKFGDVLAQIQKLGNFPCNCNCTPMGVSPQPIFFGGTIVKGNMCGDIDMTLTQMLNNVKIDLSDVEYTMSVNPDITDVVSFTPTEGNCSKDYQLNIDFSQAILSLNICISKTAFVTPCGNDTTGELGNFLKPFATIKGAVKSTTSNTGQTVWVWPSTYNESKINFGSDNVEKMGLTYYLAAGAIVNATDSNPIFSTIATPGTVTVRGAGVLQSNGGIIVSNTVSVDYDIEASKIINTGGLNGIQIKLGSFRFSGYSITSSVGACIDTRTGNTTGYVKCEIIDCTALGIPAIKIGADFFGIHTWTFNVDYCSSLATASNSATLFVLAATGSKIWWNGGRIINQSASPSQYCAAVEIDGGGKLIIQDTDIETITGGHGIVCIQGTLVARNCHIRVAGNWSAARAMNPPGNGLMMIQGCQLVNNSASVGTIGLDSGATTSQIQIKDCIIANEDSSSGSIGIELNFGTQLFVMDDCMIMVGGSGSAGISIKAAVNINSRITNSWSNVAVGGAGTITDLVQALNVDTSLIWSVY